MAAEGGAILPSRGSGGKGTRRRTAVLRGRRITNIEDEVSASWRFMILGLVPIASGGFTGVQVEAGGKL